MDISEIINIKDVTTQMVILALTGAGGFVTYYFGFRKNSDSNALMQFTPEQYKRNIELERNDAVEEYKKANTDSEKVVPLRKITEFDNRLADIPKALQETKARIEIIETVLKNERKEIGAEKLATTLDDLRKGNFSNADKVLANITERKDSSMQRAGRIAFARGEIAEQEIRWRDAAKHYARAAHLDPCFETLIMAQELSYAMGDYSTALSFNIKLKKAAIAEYEKESQQYAQTINDLATIYNQQEKYELAEPLHKEALKLRQDILGEEHPDTAESLNNIASFYVSLEEYKKAEPFSKQALNIRKKTLGENHPDTASTISNLAEIYCSQEKYKKAKKFHKKALMIRQEVLNKNHPDIANSLNNLGGVYFEQEQYKKTEPLCWQALKILETTLGLDHPHTKQTKANYEFLKERLANAENGASQ